MNYNLVFPLSNVVYKKEDCYKTRTTNFINIMISLVAAFIAFKKNENTCYTTRILYTVLAGLFPLIYILYIVFNNYVYNNSQNALFVRR